MLWGFSFASECYTDIYRQVSWMRLLYQQKNSVRRRNVQRPFRVPQLVRIRGLNLDRVVYRRQKQRLLRPHLLMPELSVWIVARSVHSRQQLDDLAERITKWSVDLTDSGGCSELWFVHFNKRAAATATSEINKKKHQWETRHHISLWMYICSLGWTQTQLGDGENRKHVGFEMTNNFGSTGNN